MGFLKSLKDTASSLRDVADKKLTEVVETASSYLIPETEPAIPEKSLNQILYDLVYKKKKYEKAIEICNKNLYASNPEDRAIAYNFRAICYLRNAESVRATYNDYSEEERCQEGFEEIIAEARAQQKELLDLALSDIDTSLRISEENELIWYDFSSLDKGSILWGMGRLDEARRWFILAMKSSDDSIRSDAKSNYEAITECILNLTNKYLSMEEEKQGMRELCEADGDSEETIKEWMDSIEDLLTSQKFENEYSFGDRQFMFIVKNTDKIAGCYDSDGIINWVFTLNQIPASIVFPAGHPQANTLYVAHPAQKGVYLPYEGAEDKIFHEKIEDFCRLAQCLGATEISFSSIKGEAVSEGFSSQLNIGGSIGVKGNSVGGEYSRNQSSTRAAELHNEVGYSYSLQPKKAYIPTDLNWLDIDKSWQSFVKQRMEGNILSYTKRISSSEAVNISNSLQMSAKASFENLMANVNGNYSIERDTTFSHNQSSEWEIRIQFASLDELEQNEQAIALQRTEQFAAVSDKEALTEAEERYKEEVLFILEDGEITETERRFLERKRVKLGLTEEQAAKVEALCVPTFSDAEKEYLDIYKEIVGDGPITDRKRRMLNREAESLGLSEERVHELESLIKID